MTRLEDRQTLMSDIAQACAEGARLAPAVLWPASRTLQRWKIDGLTRGDRRPDADHPVPSHALSEAERARIMGTAAVFLLAFLTVLVWGGLGPIMKFFDTWQLLINTGTSIVTFKVVFLIQSRRRER
jgi:hypothetical protein